MGLDRVWVSLVNEPAVSIGEVQILVSRPSASAAPPRPSRRYALPAAAFDEVMHQPHPLHSYAYGQGVSYGIVSAQSHFFIQARTLFDVDAKVNVPFEVMMHPDRHFLVYSSGPSTASLSPTDTAGVHAHTCARTHARTHERTWARLDTCRRTRACRGAHTNARGGRADA